MDKFTVHRRALTCIAQGALTNSKRPESHVKGVYPTHIGNCRGSVVFGADGKEYIDFICGLGTNLLGYGNAAIAAAIQENLYHGYSVSFGTLHEIQAAEMVKEFFPFVDTMKFLKTGTEACMAAVRIARAWNGRHLVLSEGYHGWSDGFVSLAPPATGCLPPEGQGFAKLTSLDDITRDVAAVIVEPVITDDSMERREWLKSLRNRCTATGAVLIFDEIITGFRYESFGVSNAWNIQPDLICLGKCMGGGLPLSAVAGKKELMNDPMYFVSSTFAGECLSLAACKAFLRALRLRHKHILEAASYFKAKFNALCPRIQIQGYPARGVFVGLPLDKALFFQEACKAGILFGPSFFFCDTHIGFEDIVLETCKRIFERLERGEIALEGEMPQSPFAQKVRES